jgi:hypothetical protein
MRRNLFCLSINMLFIFNTNAQSTVIDKNKVGDYFQNQQFEEAIRYLAPALQSDSNNVPLLGYTGYAYYMIAALADVLIDKRYYPLCDSMLDAGLDRDSLNINTAYYLFKDPTMLYNCGRIAAS